MQFNEFGQLSDYLAHRHYGEYAYEPPDMAFMDRAHYRSLPHMPPFSVEQDDLRDLDYETIIEMEHDFGWGAPEGITEMPYDLDQGNYEVYEVHEIYETDVDYDLNPWSDEWHIGY